MAAKLSLPYTLSREFNRAVGVLRKISVNHSGTIVPEAIEGSIEGAEVSELSIRKFAAWIKLGSYFPPAIEWVQKAVEQRWKSLGFREKWITEPAKGVQKNSRSSKTMRWIHKHSQRNYSFYPTGTLRSTAVPKSPYVKGCCETYCKFKKRPTSKIGNEFIIMISIIMILININFQLSRVRVPLHLHLHAAHRLSGAVSI